MTDLSLGQRRKLARAISCVENRSDGYAELLRKAYAHADWPAVIGVTGPPGAGKSTLVDAMAAHWAKDGRAIAILAIDPSSPFSGGAVLGDRIRMDRSQGLENVFFRSLSARGHLGGASATACDLMALLAYYGFDRIILETVGAGQTDIEITGLADCTIVLAVPGLGDTVQAIKAGIMEIADVYAVNKSDLPGAAATRMQIESTLALAYPGKGGVSSQVAGEAPLSTPGVQALMRRHGNPYSEATFWHPPVVPVSASKAEGVEPLIEEIEVFLDWNTKNGRLKSKRKLRIRDQILRLLAEQLLNPYTESKDGNDDMPAILEKAVQRVLVGEMTPQDAVTNIVSQTRHTGNF